MLCYKQVARMMSASTKKQQLQCTLKTGTVFVTAQGETITHNPGTGCSLEVTSWFSEDRLQVGGGETITHNPGTGCSLEVISWFSEDRLQVWGGDHNPQPRYWLQPRGHQLVP